MVDDTLLGIPDVGETGGNGTRIVLGIGNITDVPYAIGIGTNVMWHSVPDAAGTSPAHSFYVGTTEVMSANLQAIQVNTFDVATGEITGTTNAKTGYLKISGNLTASGDILSSYSDMRLKTIIGKIENPLDKIEKIETFTYVPNDLARSLNICDTGVKIGISAQDVQAVLPEVVSLAPFDSSNLDNGSVVSKSSQDYLTVSYERLVPLLIECIKELKKEIAELKATK